MQFYDIIDEEGRYTFGPSDDSVFIMDSKVSVDTGAGNDQVNIHGVGENTINTGDGADEIDAYYTEDSQTLIAGAGNDFVAGGLGNDSIDGGAGNDDLSGFEGNDTIVGGAGDDFIESGYGNDSLSGGAGDDFINFGFGDIVRGGPGADVFNFAPDRLRGRAVIEDFNPNEGDVLILSFAFSGNETITDLGDRLGLSDPDNGLFGIINGVSFFDDWSLKG